MCDGPRTVVRRSRARYGCDADYRSRNVGESAAASGNFPAAWLREKRSADCKVPGSEDAEADGVPEGATSVPGRNGRCRMPFGRGGRTYGGILGVRPADLQGLCRLLEVCWHYPFSGGAQKRAEKRGNLMVYRKIMRIFARLCGSRTCVRARHTLARMIGMCGAMHCETGIKKLLQL